MQPGYPPRYYADKRSSWLGLCYPIAVLTTFLAGFAFVLWVGVGNVTQAVGLGLVVFLLVVLIGGNLTAWRKARVFPYYDKILPKAGTYLSGQAILRNLQHLDGLAETRGIKAISAFGFPDALRGEQVIWHDAAEGLRTIEGLLQVLIDQPEAVDQAAAVVTDLEKIRNALEQARATGTRFSFLIEDMGGTSGLVWERRGGHV